MCWTEIRNKVTFRDQEKVVFLVRVCSVSTAVIPRHGWSSVCMDVLCLLQHYSLMWIYEGHCHRPSIVYLTWWLSSEIVTFWKLLYQSCLKMHLWLWDKFWLQHIEAHMLHKEEVWLDVVGQFHALLSYDQTWMNFILEHLKQHSISSMDCWRFCSKSQLLWQLLPTR